MSIQFPDLDPNAITIGVISIKWYAIAYIIGILYSYFFTVKNLKLTKIQCDEIILYSTVSMIIGGRIGYIIFYNLSYYIDSPLEIMQIWQGGLSFHGGAVGVFIGLYLFARKYSIDYFTLTDLLACSVSVGIFFGRLANFVNGELYGRVTTASWGVIFPYGGDLPRHPSQIYESLSEGFLLFIIMNLLFFYTDLKKYRGFLSGLWLLLYSIFRIILENFREPDQQIGYILQIFTMGQILSIPLILTGLMLLVISRKNYND